MNAHRPLPLTRQDKAIALLLAALSLVGAAVEIWRGLDLGLEAMRALTSLALVAIGLAGAYGSLKGRRGGALLGNLFFLAQIPHFESPELVFSPALEPTLVVSAVYAGSGLIGVNLIATGMFVWSSIRMASANSPFREVLPRPGSSRAQP